VLGQIHEQLRFEGSIKQIDVNILGRLSSRKRCAQRAPCFEEDRSEGNQHSPEKIVRSETCFALHQAVVDLAFQFRDAALHDLKFLLFGAV